MGIYNAMFRSEQEADDFYETYLQKYQAIVFRLILRYVNDREAAEDLMQETMYSALKNTHQLKDVRKSCAWLMSIAHNKTMTYLRKHKTDPPPISLENCPKSELETMPSALEEVIQRYNATLWIQALNSLDPIDHAILWLHLEQDYTFQQIADIHEIPLKTVCSKYYRGLEKVTARLRKLNKYK